jgi:hypothetical protein
LRRVFLRELVRATLWGIVFLLVVAVFSVGAKQNIKEAIDFSFRRAVGDVYFFVSSPQVKQDIKEAAEFMSDQSNKQVKQLFTDSDFKQAIKEAIDLWYAYKYKKTEPTGKLTTTQ